MKVYTYTLSLTFLILSFTAGPLCAQDRPGQIRGYPDAEQAVEITDLRLLGSATKGNNVTLQVRFRSHVDGPGTIMLRYPKHVAPPGRRPEEKFRTQSLSLKEDKEYVKTYPMRVHDTGGAMVSAIVRAKEVPEGYDASASEHVNVVSGTDTYQVFAPDDTTRRRVTATKGTTEKLKTTSKVEAKSGSYYTVSVSGEIDYYDPDQFRREGLFGVEVELWFRDSSNPDELYHPFGEAEHVTYDEVEEDGQYHFNFSFSGDLSGYDELLVLVTSSNDAASLSIDQGAWIIDSGDGTETSFGTQQGVVYDISGRKPDISIADADAEVNSADGAVLRNMMLSREFVRERYDYNVPFDLPIVQVIRKKIDPAGAFCEPEDDTGLCGSPYPVIYVDDDDTDLELSAHEYGHYAHYRMWGGGDGPLNGPDAQLKEGWAIFYSFAARNYATEAYGDELDRYDDNTEEDAFEVGTRDDGSSYRFRGIGYADGGNPSYAAFACYLWSLYDSYSGGPFEASRYDSGDNDDVSGYAQRVFNVFRKKEKYTVSGYNDAFKNGLGSDTQTSVQSAYDFMTANYSSVPNTPMRPPQLTDASGQITSSGDVSLQWDQQSYPSGRDYGNYPAGYRIYKDGSAVATVSSGTTSYTYTPSGTNSGNYQLTAYNTNGEARAAPTLDLGIDVTLSGSEVLDSGEQGSWSASVSGGSGPISNYDWSVQPVGSFSWQSKACSNSSCSHTFYNPNGDSPKNAKVKVVVTRGDSKESSSLTVGVQPPPSSCEYFCEGSRVGVPLRNVSAKGTGGSVLLTWRAAPSTVLETSSRLVVQHRADRTGAWSALGTVAAADSAAKRASGPGARYQFAAEGLAVGPHQFRLAVEADGKAGRTWTSEPVRARVELTDAYRLSAYPNPMRQRATVELAVKEAQEVTVRLYDVLGRAVTTLHEGPVPAQETKRFRLDAPQAGLSSGTYFLRVRGAAFTATRQLSVVR